jgi:DNA-binding transcriptional LysR family regulator
VQNSDLNLLHLLSVLYEERSVSRAAERLCLTPSAISHSLRRLRLMLDDELFSRGPGGMTPTPRAHEIARRLNALLPQLNAVLEPQHFDPARTDRNFAICCVPYLTSTFIPAVAAAFHAAAPGARLDTTTLHGGVVDELVSGDLDVALGNFRRTPSNLVTEELIREDSVWVMRRNNPFARSKITLATLARMPHVDVVLGNAVTHTGDSYDVRRGLERLVVHNNLGSVDAAFAQAELHREVRWRAPDSTSALAIVANTDGVTLVPASAARLLEKPLNLLTFQAPYKVSPLIIQMLYHDEFGTRPAVMWLLDCLRKAAHAFD